MNDKFSTPISTLAIVASLLSSAAFANQNALSTPTGSASAASAGITASPPIDAGTADSQTPAAEAPVTEEDISGELMHTLLGLSMRNLDISGFPREVSEAFPAKRFSWERDPDPDPRWPSTHAFQDYLGANRDYPTAEERTEDGHFFLARRDFIYGIHSGLGSPNPDKPAEANLEWVLNSYAGILIQVNDTGIVLSEQMEVQQASLQREDNTYTLAASAPRIIAKTDRVPFDTPVQTYENGNDTFFLYLKKGEDPRQVRLCWHNDVASVRRDVCQSWSIPNQWKFGMALNFDGAHLRDSRYNFPSELTNGGPMDWVTAPQSWRRL